MTVLWILLLIVGVVVLLTVLALLSRTLRPALECDRYVHDILSSAQRTDDNLQQAAPALRRMHPLVTAMPEIARRVAQPGARVEPPEERFT